VSPSVLGSCPENFKEPKSDFHDLLRQKPPSLDIPGVEFNLNGLPENAVHISGFRGEDGSIVKLNAMSLSILCSATADLFTNSLVHRFLSP
jgi:hypothetical protein